MGSEFAEPPLGVLDHQQITGADRVRTEGDVALGLGTDGAASNNDMDMFEAMRQAAVEMAENVMEKVSSLRSSLAEIAKEYAHVGRDTDKEELNDILSRIPKTTDVKG
mgnify:CR=1 FL=1